MRISDWSSDVCSSDLWRRPAPSPCGRPADMTRRLSLFGATGSVGRSTLDLVRRDGERWCVTVLTANSDVAELAKLAPEFRPEIDRKSAVSGKSVSVRVALGGSVIIKKKRETTQHNTKKAD